LSQQPKQGGIRDFASDNPALPEQAFPDESEAFEALCRSDISRVDVGLDPIEIELFEGELKQ
jgi:hypothetical protein